MTEDLSAIAEAFSRKASQYDAFGSGHPNLARMRARIREQVCHHLAPGARILEINAGTGADAAYFASRGYRVLATDISPDMVAAIREKIAREGLQDRLSARELSFTDLNQLEEGRFDGIFSNMGGLNCIRDLGRVTEYFPRLLHPGAVVTFVVMPPFCPWEWLALFRGDFKTARRRLQREGTTANVEGVRFTTYYHRPQQILTALGERFAQLSLGSLSLLAPPADRKDFALRNPAIYKTLVWLDDKLTPHRPFNQCGDFFMLSAIFLG